MAVLDYGIGNLRSAQKALERVGADARLTADHGLIRDAAAVVLPGVGAFGRAWRRSTVRAWPPRPSMPRAAAVPSSGSASGMQMLYEGSDESPGVPGLGVLPGTLRLLPDAVKRPQMQWNLLDVHRPWPCSAGLADPVWVYFVHSYAASADDDIVVATCDYGGPVAAAVERARCGPPSSTPRSPAPPAWRSSPGSWPRRRLDRGHRLERVRPGEESC